MFTGKPKIDGEQPSVTDSGGETPDSPESDGGNNDTSTISGLIATARTLSEIVSPFAGLATAIVHAITAYKFFSEVA
ncbi:hypothetical protein [Halorussus litoreus]|uniref:hypothetical protein n=1 Tax=Halorussus litoreus TaxID=1710536 RepID=UPI000E23ADCF|nr:hypothetical protein [Halorussus litoreus]